MEKNMERFPDKSRVVFVGDSITANNTFVSHIAGYYKENFPASGVEIYNLGISGATLKTTLAVFDEDILPYEPTHVVLMTGINDSHRHFLERPAPDRFDRMYEAFELFKSRLTAFADRVESIGAELILCTPMPYDEYREEGLKPLRGSASAMLGYADYIKAFAKERGYSVCDYHSYVTRELTLSKEPLYRPDRVHPTDLGHYYMAKCFLSHQGLELGERRKIPELILPWHELTRKIRDTVTAENFILLGDFSKTDEERMKAILDYVETPNDDPNREHFLTLVTAYPENKRNQKRNIELVKAMMKR